MKPGFASGIIFGFRIRSAVLGIYRPWALRWHSRICRCDTSRQDTTRSQALGAVRFPKRRAPQALEKLIRKQVLHWIAGQPAKARLRVPVRPPPHHTSRGVASEELRPKQPMESREERAEKYVFQPVPATRIGTIAGLPRRLPSYACHRAPHRPFGLPLCDYHGLPFDLLKRERLGTTLKNDPGNRRQGHRNRRLRCPSPPSFWGVETEAGRGTLQCLRTDINAGSGHTELRSVGKAKRPPNA